MSAMGSCQPRNILALEILFHVVPSHRTEFLQTAESLLRGTAAEPGVDSLSCFEQVGATNTFLWRERWRSLQELEARLHSRALGTLLGAIGVLGELESFDVLTPTDTRDLNGEPS